MNMNRKAVAETLGVRIKRLRLAHGLSQVQLGELIGISSTSVGNWETDEHLPRGRYVIALAAALGVNVAALLGETSKSLDDLAEEIQLLVAFKALPRERQLIAIKLVEALK